MLITRYVCRMNPRIIPRANMLQWWIPLVAFLANKKYAGPTEGCKQS